MSKGVKRSAPPSKGPSKKQKTGGKPKSAARPPTKPKSKAPKALKPKDQTTIAIPTGADDDYELSDQDYELAESLPAAAFLTNLDKKGLSRSKKETERLHQLHKPERPKRKRIDDDLPSVDSHSDDGELWDSDVGEELLDSDIDDDDLSSVTGPSGSQDDDAFSDSDAEMPYETAPRGRRNSWDPEDTGVSRLPIKLANGEIQKSKEKVVLDSSSEEEEESEEEPERQPEPVSRRDDVATGARFGRPAVVDVIGKGTRKARIQAAREQIASICQEILSDPENSLGLLRRLHTFSLLSVTTPSHPEPVENDPVIRRLATLSQLAVFKDVIPGYRIRPLSDKEKSEKVSQAVSRTREWEQSLVGVYQTYLRALEAELKGKTELADLALQCMCALITEAAHFNFRTNILASIIARLSKKSWDEGSELGLTTLIAVFRADLTGQASLETVRLLNRMVKERRFSVHPAVLSCLLHLRLHSELGVRASQRHAEKDGEEARRKAARHSAQKEASRRAKGKPTAAPHLSKKTKKMKKEQKEIEEEMQEAAADVDKEEKATAQTETLKLLFVLYFRILKTDRPTPLLSAALRGISKYAHQVNVDFFRDLMTVLKAHVAGTHWKKSEQTEDGDHEVVVDDVHTKLECIVTAFELLTGQGEALDLDLSDLIRGLYALLLPLGVTQDIEATPPNASRTQAKSAADLLFRALDLGLNGRANAGGGVASGTSSAGRRAAFARRLLGCALGWPGASAARAIKFVHGLVARDKRLLALLDADEAIADGVWRPEIEDPDLANALAGAAWEIGVLKASHVDERVRTAAVKLGALVHET